MSESFDPYHKWLGIPPDEQPPNHYRLLALPEFESDGDVISNAADQRMMHIRSFQSGTKAKLSQRILNELSEARVCLLDPQEKATYDAELKAKIDASRKPAAKAAPRKVKAASVVNESSSKEGEFQLKETRPPRQSTRKKSRWLLFGVLGAAACVLIILSVVVIRFATSGDSPISLEKIAKEETPPSDIKSAPPKDKPESTGHEQASTPDTDPPDEDPFPQTKSPEDPQPGGQPASGNPNETDPSPRINPPEVPIHGDPPPEVDPMPDPAPTSRPPVAGPIDLLARIDLQRDVINGQWKRRDQGGLVCTFGGGNDTGLLRVPFDPPEDYDLTIVATRTAGDSALQVPLVIGGSQCSVVLDGYGGRISGIQFVNGKIYRENITKRDIKMFTNGKPTTLVLQVRKNTLRVLSDGDEKITWQLDPSTLSADEVGKTVKVGLGGWNASFEISSYQLTPAHGATVPAQNVPKLPEIVYLDDLKEADFQVGYGTLGKRGATGYPKSNGSQRIRFRGQVPAHGLSVHPVSYGSSRVDYYLDGSFDTFAASAGIFSTGKQQKTEVTFQVIGDGRVLWQSPPVGKSGQWHECTVKINRVETLRLEVVCPGPAPYVTAAWVNPRLNRRTAHQRVPPPAISDQHKALAIIQETFKNDFAGAVTHDAKAALSKKLLELAASEKEPAVLYALLRLAAKQAASAGDVQAAMDSFEELTARFEVDGTDLKLETLLAIKPRGNEQMLAFAEHALRVLDEAVGQDRYEDARRLGTMAHSAARKAKDAELAREIAARNKEVESVAKAFTKIQEALTVLKTSADDPDANLAVGRFYCLVKGDWQRGLPAMAKSSDSAWSGPAARDLSAPEEAKEQVAIGSQWWDLAESLKGPGQEQLQLRAAHWYETALPQLSDGLDKVRVEKRLATLSDATTKTAAKTVFLDDLQEVEFKVGYLKTLGKHGWKTPKKQNRVSLNGAIPAHSIFLHAQKEGSAFVVYDLDGKYAEFTATAAISDRPRNYASKVQSRLSFKVIGDGKLLWQSRPLGTFSDFHDCVVKIEKVKQLKLRVDCPGHNGNGWSAWIRPAVSPKAQKRSQAFHNFLGYELKQHPQGAVKFGNHFYAVIPGKLTWTAAQQRCKQMGGYLVCVESPAEVALLRRFAKKKSDRFWLGGVEVREGKWIWVNGSSPSFTNWNPKEPNNKGGGEDRIMMTPTGSWYDVPNGHGYNTAFICEWEF